MSSGHLFLLISVTINYKRRDMQKEELKERISGLLNDENYKPLNITDLIMIFSDSKKGGVMISEVIREMEEDGDLFINKKGKIGSLAYYGIAKGKFMAKTKGFGFISLGDQDVYIGADDTNHAFNDDTVIVKITKDATGDKKAEGVIIRIVERANDEFVGRLEVSKNFGFVVPDRNKMSTDIFVAKRDFNGAKENDMVVCKITKWPDSDKGAKGVIVDVIGQRGERYVEIDSIIRSHKLPDAFPKKVEIELKNIPDSISKSEMEGRLDLRDRLTYTIDGSDSKDFDDAIDIVKEGNIYKLGVHIADVTHYVRENSNLDKEALKRATSVYMVDKVVPMLPEKLSNGLCSLNPGVDRLTLSCLMDVDSKTGKVVNYNIEKTIINSKARMTYTQVSDILENEDRDLIDRYSDFVESFKNARDLADILRKKREKRGAIDFDFPEAKIKLDSQGMPVDIAPYERRVSNKMIEEFMLLANETVAEHYFWLKVPFVYRVHEEPDEDKIVTLKNFIAGLNYKMPMSKGGLKSKDMQKLLGSIDHKEEKRAIGSVMLRSLRQARYSPECLGHFGLAAKYYSHFTSPIRRYPDLQIHRIIKEDIEGRLSDKRKAHYASILEDVSSQSSTQERKAEMAEREVDDYYKSVYMSTKIGEVFEGAISGVTSFGIFVELDNGVEGLIRLRELPDMYIYNDISHTLVGERTGNVFRLGQVVQVELINVNVEAREIDFDLV